MRSAAGRVVRGFLVRLEKFCPNAQPPVPTQIDERESLAAQVHAVNVSQTGQAVSQTTVILTVALRLKSIADQTRFFAQFTQTKHYDVDVLKCLALGSQFSGYRGDFKHLSSLHDVDYSLIDTATLVGSVLIEKNKLGALLRRTLGVVYYNLGIKPPSNCSSLANWLSAFGINCNVSSLGQLTDVFYSLKQAFWPIFGSDFLVYMATLSDPNVLLTVPQLVRLHKLACFWKFGAISAQLIILRSFNSYQAECEFFEENKSELLSEAMLPPAVIKAVTSGDTSDQELSSVRDPIHLAIIFSVRFSRSLRSRAVNRLLADITKQFEIDHGVLLFLDWNLFQEHMPIDWGPSYLTNILLGITLLNPSIFGRFECVAFSYGRGFVSNQLISYATMLRGQKQGMSHFARNISALKPKAKTTIGEFVLQKSIIERYSFAFQDRFPKNPKLKTNASPDLEVCNARIRLALLLRDMAVLPPELSDRVLLEEASFRKMYRFQEVFRNGRIRIDWSYLEEEVVEALETDFGYVFRSLSGKRTAISGPLATIVANLLANRITEISLFDSVTSFEGALSNNLRHGVVVPRFLRAFTESMGASVGGPNRNVYLTRFAREGEKMYQLEVRIKSIIFEFQENWLRVVPKGEFSENMSAKVTSIIRSQITKSTDFKIENVMSDVIAAERDLISRLLREARDALLGATKTEAEAEVTKTSINIGSLAEGGAREYIDSLSINLEHAFNEVSGWLALVDYEHSKSVEFEIGALIDEEAFTFGVSERSRQRVKYEFVDRGTRDRKIRNMKIMGSAFDLFDQLIHNSITNARRQSGLGNDTDIFIRIIRDRSDLVVWVANSFASGLKEEMVTHQNRAKALIGTAIPPRGRKKRRPLIKEGGSGFKKVIAASERVLGCRPKFNFPPISSEEGQFIVEIQLPNAAKMVIHEERAHH